MLLSSHMQWIALIYLVLLSSCANNAEPQLEEWGEGSYKARQVSAYNINGKRDGATTRATAMLILRGGERLHLELKVDYDPQPVLGEGKWRLEGDRADSGAVIAEALKFFGGQSEGPSLGGRFLLQGNNGLRFRVVLPLRPVEGSRWKNR